MSTQQQPTANPLHEQAPATGASTPNPIAAPAATIPSTTAVNNANIMMSNAATAAAVNAAPGIVPGVNHMPVVPMNTPVATAAVGGGPKEEYEEIREQVNY